jgi:HEAT repeat protein
MATDLARNPDPSIRGSAAQALSATSDKEALSVLQALLQDQQPLPRLMAAKALGKLSGPVIPILLKGLQDSDEAVRIAAAGSLLQQTARAARPTRRP